MSIIQRTSFNSLPLELRQAVYHYAATDNRTDNHDDDDGSAREVRVTYKMNDTTDAEIGTLQSQAIATLEKLLKVARNTWQEPVDYLTGPLFCWVLISDEAPHMFLLRALRKSVPKEVFSKIVHARLLRVSLQRHTFGVHSESVSVSRAYQASLDMISASAYLSHLGSQYTAEENHLIAKVKSDIRYAMTLLPHTFTSLRRLDINLDIVDCIHKAGHPPALNIRDILGKDFDRHNDRGPLVEPLATLRHMKTISLVDIRVLWVDFLGSRRPSGYDLCDVTVQNFQQILIEALKKRIPAKSITGHA
jgi:hypothetical protein